MSPEALKTVIANISKHEGRKAQMYLDSVGVVTCGVGHAIQRSDDAYCFDWHRIDRPAERAEILADYTNVKYAKRPGTLFLPVEEMDRLLAYDLGKFEHILEAEFPDFRSYPLSVQVALFDIAYNTGSVSPNKWKHLNTAVKARDWQTAAKECARPQVGDGRNEDTAKQFLRASGTSENAA